jgi:glycerophosphoryl diester phosphodiesterase
MPLLDLPFTGRWQTSTRPPISSVAGEDDVSAEPAGASNRAVHPYLLGPYPRALAHRGWCLDELAGAENSMPALRRALDEGFRYLEIDVHATSDGVVVVSHDPDLDRATDRSGPIVGQPWEQVRQAKVAGRAPVPALREVLEELPAALLNIDVKADQAVEPTLRLIEETDAWDRVALASFSHARLTRMRTVGGDRLITSCSPRDAGALRVRGWLRAAHLHRAGTALPVRAQLAQVPRTQGIVTVVDRSLVDEAHELGMEVHVWTINDSAVMRDLLDLGVDGLVTDRPDLLRGVLGERNLWPTR